MPLRRPMTETLDCPERRAQYALKAVNPLNEHNSDNAIRIGFRNGNDEFPTLVDPSNTIVVASQAPLGTSRTKMCRRSYPVVSGLIAVDTSREPCRDPRRDVDMVVADAILSPTRVVVPVAKFGKAGH